METYIVDDYDGMTKSIKRNPILQTLCKPIHITYDEAIKLIEDNPKNISKIQNPDKRLVLKAVLHDGLLITKIPREFHLDEEICKTAISTNPYAIAFIKDNDVIVKKYSTMVDARVLKFI